MVGIPLLFGTVRRMSAFATSVRHGFLPFAEGDAFFVSPPAQAILGGVCYAVPGKNLQDSSEPTAANGPLKIKPGGRVSPPSRRRFRFVSRIGSSLTAAVTSMAHVSATSAKVMVKAVPAVAPSPVPPAVNRLAGCDRRDD